MTHASVFTAGTISEPAIEFDTLRKPLALNIDVLSGVHSGVSQRIESGEILIGSGADCDVILFADPLAERHLSIAPKSVLGSTVVIKALDGRVTLDNGTTLEPGQWAEGRMPLDLSVEGTHVTVSRTINPHEFARPALAVATALALIVLGPNLVNTAFSSASWSSSDFRVVARNANPGVERPNDIITNASSISETEDAAIGLRTRIRDAGLGHMIDVVPGRDGTILVSGEIGPGNASEWRGILRWYDGVPGAPSLLNGVRRGVAPEMPSIASAWLLGDKHITLSTGERLREGDRVKGGWTVKSIAEDGVILNRNGSDVTLTF